MEIDKAFWGIVGVIVGFALTTIKDWRKQKATLQKDRYYLSILAVSKLDDFFGSSCAIVSDGGRYVQRGNELEAYLEPQSEIPIFELSSMDVDWRCLPQNLMFELLTFSSKVEQANRMIEGVNEYQATPPDFDEFFQERRYQYATLGLKAADLAAELRKLSKLPKHEYGAELWDPIADMLKERNEIEAIREQHRVIQQESAKQFVVNRAETNS